MMTERKNPAGRSHRTMYKPHYMEVYNIIVDHPEGITSKEICGLMVEPIPPDRVGNICQNLSSMGLIEQKGKVYNGMRGRVCVWRAR